MKLVQLRFCALVAMVLCAGVSLAKSGENHIKDALAITMDSSKDAHLHDLMSYISQGMDYGKTKGGDGIADAGSGFLKTIRAEFASEGYESLSGLGKHHYYSHWDFNGAIPKDMLKKIRGLVAEGKLPSDAEERFILRWRQFVFSRTQAVKQVFGLTGDGSDKVARAFASIVDDIHNLGDWAFDKDVEGLRSVDDITRNYLKSCNKILGKHNNITKAIKAEIAALPKMEAKEKAQAIIKILESHNKEMSERFCRVFSRYGYKGKLGAVDYAVIIKETARIKTAEAIAKEVAEKSAVSVAKKTSTVNAARKVFETSAKCKTVVTKTGQDVTAKTVETTAQKAGFKNTKVVRGLLQRVISKEGRETFILSVPVAAAAKGAAAGVLTFVLSEGYTAVGLAKGEMNEDAFWVETWKNAGAAVVEGVAVTVVCCLGFGPAGVVAIAVGIGAYVIYEVVFNVLYDINKFKGITLDDYLGVMPTEIQRRASVFDYEGACKVLNYEGTSPGLGYEGKGQGLDYKGTAPGIGEVPNMRKDNFGL